jgi:hypothetical protein
MSFISLNFVTLFVCTFLLYYTLPPKYRKAILLLSSCIFIGYYHIAFLIIALLISLATFFLGKWVGQSKHEKDAKRIYISGLCFLITGWLAFRYANLLPGVHWLFPLGISFYTFQALSYLTEIYWKEEEPEENLADFMIYMLFFMKFLSGPIERARDMLPQLKSGKPVAYPSIVYGMKLIVVGLIKKLILADYKIFHQYRPYMQGVINPYGAIRDAVTNDAINPREGMIRDEGEAYWENHKKEFVKARDCNYRNGEYREGERFLWETQTELLKEIDQICRKHNTSVKIIISPDYNQISINPADVEILKDIFGYENVFDFSGINEYTNDIHNYYERGHYRPILGARLLQKVYANHN